MEVILSSYSLQNWMKENNKNQFDCLQKSAELGMAGMEFTGLIPPTGESTLDFAARIRAEAQRLGLTIENYAVGADFINGSDGDLDREVARVCALVDDAAALGAPRMRHDVVYALRAEMTFESILPRLAEGCRRVTEYAATKGIATMVENHGLICQEPERVLALYHAVGHPNFGLLTDIGNFLCADAEPAASVLAVAPYARYVHAKDFLYKDKNAVDPGDYWFRSRGGSYLRGTVIGHGIVPVGTCLGYLKAAGYNGPITLEYEGMERNIDALTVGKKNLERFWENA